PVISDIARQVVEEQFDSEWRYTVTGEDGTVVSNGTTRRRPDAKTKRRVQARAPTCVFPGCRMPAVDCDLDHHRPWARRGRTREHNLGPFCRHHHVIRHRGWDVVQTHPGTYQLTSPLGHVYTSRPRAP
ncbi:MAG: HNH endonuclease signature motif containing protein, partial [Acidimicrobiia bacterium]